MAIDLTGAGTTTDTLSITSNFNFFPSALDVGGYNGITATRTNGRGAVNQINGLVQTSSGNDLSIASGSGSTGTYTLSGGGAVNALQSETVGYLGTGTFTQTNGTNTLQSSSVGTLTLGLFSGSSGTYNLSGGSLTSNVDEVVGNLGTGVFNQTGGMNTIQGTKSLYIGENNGGNGTYTLSGSASLTVGGTVYLGNNDTAVATLNIQNNSSLYITHDLWFFNHTTVNLSGGTLRFDQFVPAGGTFNYTAGTIQLKGNKTVGSSDAITSIFGTFANIPTGKGLTIEGVGNIQLDTNINGGKFAVKNNFGPAISNDGIGWSSGTPTVTVSADGDMVYENANLLLSDSGVAATLHVTGNGSTVTVSNDFHVGYSGAGHLQIDSGAAVTNNGNAFIAPSSNSSDATVTGQGSIWTIGGNLTVGNTVGGTLNIASGATVSVGSVLTVSSLSTVNIDGGTLRMVGLNSPAANFHYDYGTIDLFGGTRTIGTDPVILEIFGHAAVLNAGKNLTIEGGTAILNEPLTLSGGTLRSNGFAINSTFQFTGGVLQVDNGSIVNISNLNIPSGGELRINGTAAMNISGAAGSTITCLGLTTLGNATSVNGFGTQGNLVVGQTVLTLQDANDVVFDALSYTSIGTGVNGGVINATNGLTLNFGGNITGNGNINSNNLSANPLINNGHIAGTSTLARITLSGYVKGVGTFENVTTTGTFSPGLSPAIVSTTNFSLASTNTLLMELGGTAVGSGYDQVQDGGLLTLGGTLQVSLINGFTPASGNSFDLLNWSTLGGTFSSISLPAPWLGPDLEHVATLHNRCAQRGERWNTG